MPADRYSLDYETASACPIGLGAYKYSEDPTTRILMFAIARNDEDPVVWSFDQPDEKALALFESALLDPEALIYAHNAGFEIAVTRYRARPDLGFVGEFDISQWRCTAAMCRTAAIPYSLDGAAKFLRLEQQKASVGKALIRIFSDATKPVNMTRSKEKRKVANPHPVTDADWLVTLDGEKVTIAEAWEMFREYCRQDVIVEREIHRRLAKFELKGTELAGFHFDLRMNDLGVPINRPALLNAKTIVDEHRDIMTAEFETLTGLQPTQTARVLEWLQERGYKGENLQKASMADEALREGMSAKAVEALKLRAALSFVAVKKIPAMLDAANTDDRIRGQFMWYGAPATGRWSSRGVQLQNVRRPTIKDPDAAYADIRLGLDTDLFGILHGNPFEAVASCIRNFVMPREGMMLDADYSNIEGRVAAWICGQEEMMEDYRQGRDRYKVLASAIFGVPVEEVTKEQRFVGKVGELSCIAEGQMVLTNNGLKPIEQVQRCDLVWDGVEWVSHEGVIYQGEKEVIEHQGLVATPDHQVFCTTETGQARKIPFGVARSNNHQIIETGSGRNPLRAAGHRVQRNQENRGVQKRERRSSVRLRESSVGEFGESGVREKLKLPFLLEEKALPEMAGGTGSCAASPLHQPSIEAMGELRRQRDRVSFRFSERSVRMGYGQSRAETGHGTGSDRQQRALRARKPEMGHSPGADIEHADHSHQRGLPRGGVAILDQRGEEKKERGHDPRADFRRRKEGGSGEKEKLEGYPRKVRVYDIVNAGPRRRFTVSGLLVSNCCYSTGAKKFFETCEAWGMPIPRKLAAATVRTYREVNDKFPETWRRFGWAVKKAMENPREWHAANDLVAMAYSRAKPFPRLLVRLPSGRRLVYPHPLLERVTVKHKDFETGEVREWETDQIKFWGPIKGHVGWGMVKTYSASIFQSSVQATARDIMQHGCLTADARGFDIFAIIHDQALAHDGDPDAFIAALCDHPSWLPADFPLVAEGGRVPYYSKD